MVGAVNLRVLTCPHCGAPVSASRFAKVVSCSSCRAEVRIDTAYVDTKRYRQAHSAWQEPSSAELSLGSDFFQVVGALATTTSSEVHLVRRVRFPSELLVAKIATDGHSLNTEAKLLNDLGHALTGSAFRQRIPTVASCGVGSGLAEGRSVLLTEWRAGFRYTLSQAVTTLGPLFPSRSIVWIWRRVLETLSSLHRLGWVHGDLTDEHIVVHDFEHGATLIGFGKAHRSSQLSDFHDDLRASARAMVLVLETLPKSAKHTDLLIKLAESVFANGFESGGHDGSGRSDPAWQLREHLGATDSSDGPRYVPLNLHQSPG